MPALLPFERPDSLPEDPASPELLALQRRLKRVEAKEQAWEEAWILQMRREIAQEVYEEMGFFEPEPDEL